MSTSYAQSQTRRTDWKVPYGEDYPIEEGLAALRCPFKLHPIGVDNVSSEYRENLTKATGENVPWTGYYTTAIPNHQILVTNAYGVWFGLKRQTVGNLATWEAFRIARSMYQLKHWPMKGLNMYELELSGKLLFQAVLQSTNQPLVKAKLTMKETFDSLFESGGPAQPSSQTERGRKENPSLNFRSIH